MRPAPAGPRPRRAAAVVAGYALVHVLAIACLAPPATAQETSILHAEGTAPPRITATPAQYRVTVSSAMAGALAAWHPRARVLGPTDFGGDWPAAGLALSGLPSAVVGDWDGSGRRDIALLVTRPGDTVTTAVVIFAGRTPASPAQLRVLGTWPTATPPALLPRSWGVATTCDGSTTLPMPHGGIVVGSTLYVVTPKHVREISVGC